MNTSTNILKNIKILNEETDEEYQVIKQGLEKKASLLKELLSHYGGDGTSVSSSYDGRELRIDLSSGYFKPEALSRYDNEIEFSGTLYLDKNLNFTGVDVKTSSGPNVVNQDFINALNALASFIKSNGDSWNA